MITREEYIKALDIVEAYHKQIVQKNDCLTNILEWHKFDNASTRLKNVLIDVYWGRIEWINYKEEYVEKIRIQEIRRFPGCGPGTLREFIELRGY